jgi:hypothetical protein
MFTSERRSGRQQHRRFRHCCPKSKIGTAPNSGRRSVVRPCLCLMNPPLECRCRGRFRKCLPPSRYPGPHLPASWPSLLLSNRISLQQKRTSAVRKPCRHRTNTSYRAGKTCPPELHRCCRSNSQHKKARAQLHRLPKVMFKTKSQVGTLLACCRSGRGERDLVVGDSSRAHGPRLTTGRHHAERDCAERRPVWATR